MEKNSPEFDVEHGMESSRSGPLTTFIMMLPLIVVPTIAMLRPADLKEGWASRLLSASDNSAASDSVTDAPEFGAGMDDFDELGLFSDETNKSASTDEDPDALFSEVLGESFSSLAPEEPPADSSAEIKPADANLPPLMARLEKMGVTRTLWFTPGNKMVGFAAFFEADRGTMSYRFESIARSQDAAANDVIQQVLAWRQETGK
jgi:hypothetical protein